MENIEQIRLDFGGIGLDTGADQRRYLARFVRAGTVRAAGNRPSQIELPAAALEAAWHKGLFDGRAVFVDHAGPVRVPSLRNLVGVTAQSRFTGEAVEGVIELYESAQAVADLLDAIIAQGVRAPDVGLSIVFWPEWEEGGKAGRIQGISHVESVDLVFQPAADGRLLQALSAAAVQAADGVERRLRDCSEVTGGRHCWQAFDVNSLRGLEVLCLSCGRPFSSSTRSDVKEEDPMLENEQFEEQARPDLAAGAAWSQALAKASTTAMLQASGLPAASRERLEAQSFTTPAEVEAAISSEREYLARLQADQVVQIGGAAPRGGHIQVGMDGMERLSLALEALLQGRSPEKNVHPLSGIREAYILLSGDYEMTGMFQAERIQFANVNSSTMANMVANALNKSVVKLFQEYPRWWEPIVFMEDFSNLQQVKWITLGGVGDLPTVAEGAAYTELTWDDQTETASFVKKGGYLGLTLEAIDKDDTRRLASAPRALAQAAWLTLSKSISSIFTVTSGTGPTMSDGTVLFHANHSNVGSTALSVTAWAATRLAMRKHAELNSAERLGVLTAPKFLLVPPDLEITALQILGTDKDYLYSLANGQAAPDNVFAEGNAHDQRMRSARSRVIVVDLWTDTSDWAAVADPMLYPTIGLGFRYGRTPEIYSVASPTAGLMFSNDTMPIKVRFFYAVGPTDWRGLYKHNV